MSTRATILPLVLLLGVLPLAAHGSPQDPTPQTSAPAAPAGNPDDPQLTAVPTKMPFQGFLTDDTGVPIDGTVSISVSLYDAASAGNLVWGPEVHSVPVSGGVFQINLGTTVPLVPQDFVDTPALFLGMNVDGGAELTPRTELMATPFAMDAFHAQSADVAGGGSLWSTNANGIHYTGGQVGVGTNLPGAPLDVNGASIFRGTLDLLNTSEFSRLRLRHPNGKAGEFAMTSSSLYLGVNNKDQMIFNGDTDLTQVVGTLQVNGEAYTLSRLGVGLSSPGKTLDVNGEARIRGAMMVGSLADPATMLDVNGAVTIRGGADIVEGFDTHADEAVEPGTVMVIDEVNAGKLVASDAPYDAKVAGVVSGAGGVKPGIKLGQDGILDGDLPVAMGGRVYVKCSTENGPIRPGDRLTTSSVSGHAMRATDRDRADGAVIGKAMSALEEGTGLVLVLVNLQ